jgi:hypothetical protein
MRRNRWIVLAVSVSLVVGTTVSWSRFQTAPVGVTMTAAAKAY